MSTTTAKPKTSPEVEAIRDLAETLAEHPDSNNITMKRAAAVALLEHVQYLDRRFSGILPPRRLLDRTFDQGVGMVDGLAGLLQALIAQVEVITKCVAAAGLLKAPAGEQTGEPAPASEAEAPLA